MEDIQFNAQRAQKRYVQQQASVMKGKELDGHLLCLEQDLQVKLHLVAEVAPDHPRYEGILELMKNLIREINSKVK